MGFALLTAAVFLLGVLALTLSMDSGAPKTPHLPGKSPGDIWDYAYFSAFAVFLITRLTLAYISDGYPSDMSCWEAWGNRMAQMGAKDFYGGGGDFFCDYPPGYLYVLGLLARFSHVFHIHGMGLPFLYKLPALFCDMALFALFYDLGRRFAVGKTALFLCCIFAVCPAFWLDSAVWGQIESVLTLLLLLTLIRLYERRYVSAAVCFTLAVLVKPQGLILTPVFLLGLLWDARRAKPILLALAGALGLGLLAAMPFSPAWQSHTGAAAFLYALNPLWLLEKYANTLASYPYFTVNAFNLYALLGLNWVSLEIPGRVLLLSLLNVGIIALGVAGAAGIFFRVKHRGSRLCLSAFFLFGFLFTFAFKMHERYILLPIAFLLLEYLFSRNRKMLWLFAGFSAVGFLNLFYVLRLAQTSGAAPAYEVAAPIALMEVLLFLGTLYVIYADYLRIPGRETGFPAEPGDAWLRRLETSARWGRLLGLFRGEPRPARQTHMTRTDGLFLVGIMLTYTLVAFSNLGDLHAPQTYYQPALSGDEFVITLSQTETIAELDYYCGIGDVDSDPGLSLSYSQDGQTWIDLPGNYCVFHSVFAWETQALDPPVQAKYLRGVSQSTDYTLFELGLRTQGGQLAKIDSVQGEQNADYGAIADEQDWVASAPSYANSTYFDEIYHPRTAYEHLHMLPYYETTHPPLGKLIMALGILLFGMCPFGWRCMGTLMGVLMLPVFYLFLKSLFGRTRYAVLGTLLFAFDFMHYALTRMGTIDSYPVLFILCMYYFMYRFGVLTLARARGESVSWGRLCGWLALSGLAMGLGCASKWTAVYAAAGLALEFFLIMAAARHTMKQASVPGFWPFCRKTCLWCLLVFVLIPAGIYTLAYLPISMVDGYGNVFEVMWNNQRSMLAYHAQLNGTHPYASAWYTWPFVYRPMWAYQAPETSIPAGTIGCISIFQNPLLSWLGIAAFFYSLYAGWKKRDKRVLFLLVALLAQYLSWVFVKRYTLQYHFFATLPFLIIFVVYAMESLEARFRRVGYLSCIAVVLCLGLFVMFYPVLTGVPVSRFYAETFLTWFRSWVFFI